MLITLAFLQALAVAPALAKDKSSSTSAPPEQTKTQFKFDFEQWMAMQNEFAIHAVMSHANPLDGLSGTIVASLERQDPDYYYHWVRDAALMMETVARFAANKVGDRKNWLRLLTQYASISRLHQHHMRTAKFNVDGSPYTGPWCQPQNDGPALRAVALMRLAELKTAEGDLDYVTNELYDGKLPTDSIIKKDLEFVAHHWRDPSCDLWEEHYGDHFYTRMVQRRALIEGARLAAKVGDTKAAQFYSNQARLLSVEILKHWDEKLGAFVPTLNYRPYPSAPYTLPNSEKPDEIDGALFLAFLHGHTNDGFLDFDDPRVISTMDRISNHFKYLYTVNEQSIPGIGIGRYTTDTFNKHRGRVGNPWFLLTAAAGQAYLRSSVEILRKGPPKLALRLYRMGEGFLRRNHYHAKGDATMDEQFDRETGEMTSAPDLGWSYKEMADAAEVRVTARKKFRRHLLSCSVALTDALGPTK